MTYDYGNTRYLHEHGREIEQQEEECVVCHKPARGHTTEQSSDCLTKLEIAWMKVVGNE
jgi:hypothetical protein